VSIAGVDIDLGAVSGPSRPLSTPALGEAGMFGG
jgi:hypothetical protein